MMECRIESNSAAKDYNVSEWIEHCIPTYNQFYKLSNVNIEFEIEFSDNVSLRKKDFFSNKKQCGNSKLDGAMVLPDPPTGKYYILLDGKFLSEKWKYDLIECFTHELTHLHDYLQFAHIFTDDELERFFRVVDTSQSVPSECPYRALVMPVFFRILYTSGMRVSELRLARLSDVNLEEGYIRVRQGKNHKDRLVPIHPDLVKKCINLKEQIHQTSPENEFFFMLRPGREMKLFNVYHNFRRYLDKAGIPHTGHGPRVHDFRHTYCVNLLRKWTEEGKDLMVYLPYMRTMLGHETFEETAYYLKLTAAAFPSIRDSLDKAFPDIIGEVTFSEHEYY